MPVQSGSAQSMSPSQSLSWPSLHDSPEAWQVQAGSLAQSGSSQSMRPLQLSSKPLSQCPASVGAQPHAGVPMQSGSLQSTNVSQSSSMPLLQFSPPGL